MTGFLPDFCRALAATVLGDAEKVVFKVLRFPQWFASVRNGDVDVLFATATRTLGREVDTGIVFPTTLYHDGQGLLAHRETGIRRLSDISPAKPATVCVVAGGTSGATLADMISRGAPLKLRAFKSGNGRLEGFMAGDCALTSTDRLLLILSAGDLPNAGDYVLLDDVLSREPLAPAVRADDPQWINLVTWTIAATQIAEVHGITAAMARSGAPAEASEARRLLGQEDDMASRLGVAPGWGRRVISAVGNYGEIFDRHLTPLGINRDLNALWRDGGLIFPPPMH